LERFFKKKERSYDASMKKIAIIRRNGLGDLLCTYPLIHYLKKIYPCCHITLFVDYTNAPLADYLDGIDKLVTIPKGNKYIQTIWTAVKHRFFGYDIAISGKTSPMRLMNIFLFVLGAKKRVAPRSGKWEDFLISDPIDPLSSTDHQALKTLKMLFPSIESIPPDCFPKVYSINRKNHTLDIPKDKLILLVSASTTRFSNRMDVDKYATLINYVTKRFPFQPLILSMQEDADRAYALQEKIIGKNSLVFPRSFETFMVALSSADFFLIGDSGVGHIAAAMKKPLVAWFGESHPNEWAPLGRYVATLYHPQHVDEITDEALQKTTEKLIQEVLSE
jgi:ADP-heptose:LPS heptosyltransferase